MDVQVRRGWYYCKGVYTSGTLGFAAPEILLQDPYMTKVDIWSLGVILYTAVCGRQPFTTHDDDTTVRRILKNEFDLDGEGWTGVSDDVKHLVRYLLKGDPESRPTASEVLKHPFVSLHGSLVDWERSCHGFKRSVEESDLKQGVGVADVDDWKVPRDLRTPACYANKNVFVPPEKG